MRIDMLLGGLVILGGLILALLGFILLIVRRKQRIERYAWLALILIGCLPLALDLSQDPNDKDVARSWIGSYSLPCSAEGRLVLGVDSRFVLELPERAVSEQGDWRYIFDDDDFILMTADNGRKIRLRVSGSRLGFEFPIGESGYDLLPCAVGQQ